MMKPLRDLDPDLRRARLLAARRKPVRGVNRAGILGGQWDDGSFVGQFRGGRGAFLDLDPEDPRHG